MPCRRPPVGLPLTPTLSRRERGKSRGKTGGKTHIFDSFECAIHALAPACAHCGCKIIGHGIESAGRFFCCARCADESGVKGARDRV